MSKKYLVTGATGFVGSCLVRKLIDNNEEVHIIVRKKSDNWRLKDIIKFIKVHYVDLNDENEIKELFEKNSFNIIYHLATYGGYNFQMDINNIINTNLIGTWNLFKYCKDSGIEMFINTSSSSEYGEKNEAMKEDMLLNPNNMYGATKVASTILCNTYAKSNDIPLITYRLFSPYGHFDSTSRLIPTVIKSCFKNEDIYLGSKNSKRDFIFIDDVIDSYLISSKINNKYGEIYNIGSGREYAVEEIVNKIVYLTKSKSKLYWGNDLGRQYEPKSWVGDISKIQAEVSWKPKVDIDEGLIKTVKWFKENLILYK
ncbi:NAD-dependent epimerase/dehydratase family protein [Clostridium gasigenes]|uniref:NAD-dependent epimerase/dehydratase family protein n=1 Tax=Clostridium gasigenes TaxID=94869 RepID=UPI0014384F16|nr:NAD-dependent epimerase/dehydratase family protein [Clostridium gasigenes]MBU3090049.1 NAD-dependent epimerase/dehydratase family protein [Clostridium gasigenes]NKF07144.1 NAD-dependent epimerase/dehydratase family protein [Clostridium gasigenes]QSW18127.1 NAD-dependent epimerase/dehydratase family protein [Clostridium gasigenes]